MLGSSAAVVVDRPRSSLRASAKELREGVFFLPWWLLLVCLVGSALATYFLLERTRAGDSPWVLFPLTAVLAPAVLAGAMVVAIVLSTALSALSEHRPGTPPEGTGVEGTLERTVPATTISTPPSTTQSASPSASPTASPSASPSASPIASPSASASASPSP